MPDGYQIFDEDKMNDYISLQKNVNSRIQEINKELEELPSMPYSIDRWIDQLPAIDHKSFGLPEYKKIYSYKKEYERLLDQADGYSVEMKILNIDKILDKISKISI